MYYMDKGIHCTKNGFPICHLDEEICKVGGCRYFVLLKKLGNCVLRVEKSDHFTFEEISHAIPRFNKYSNWVGWGVTRQRIDTMEKSACRRLKKRDGGALREALNMCAQLRDGILR